MTHGASPGWREGYASGALQGRNGRPSAQVRIVHSRDLQGKFVWNVGQPTPAIDSGYWFESDSGGRLYYKFSARGHSPTVVH